MNAETILPHPILSLNSESEAFVQSPFGMIRLQKGIIKPSVMAFVNEFAEVVTSNNGTKLLSLCSIAKLSNSARIVLIEVICVLTK